ncbi:hypothetical protein GCM10025868_23150 [Angustibacter aerolatus]|uniref:Ribosomal RNA small subunit methyltransferase G n=1 Tax=Angustibacter aerolatus TaxID=1162965 RepID=A0ABQ6JIJ6_9ACTN|nr:RsmG family class I SAM-dependent methyltransferase [Angustibacter aerolatus]GMA87065.1 hypothetical protein GCM10025868_23150 [Angustibacter aerolatus]
MLAGTGERSRLMLDVAGHRSGRRTALVALAGAAVSTVQSSGERFEMEPMSPFERKVVHDAVAEPRPADGVGGRRAQPLRRRAPLRLSTFHVEHDDLEAAAAPVPPVPPEVAHRVFGARLDLAVAYVEHLVTTGIEWGLVGPREAPRIWERHVLNCAVMADLVPEGATVADIGSGAGLPGLALAIRRPDLDVTLVEPLLRRTTWLEHVVADLDLEHVRVLRARAEEPARDPPGAGRDGPGGRTARPAGALGASPADPGGRACWR